MFVAIEQDDSSGTQKKKKRTIAPFNHFNGNVKAGFSWF